MRAPKAISVGQDGKPDGFSIVPGFFRQADPQGPTRLVVAVPPEWLERVHRELLAAVDPPLSVMWRRTIDRAASRQLPKPRDFVSVDHSPSAVNEALDAARDLIYGDARGELWIKGRRGEQLVIDGDGMIYGYPYDPSWCDVCRANGLPEGVVPTLLDRDYVMGSFIASADAEEQRLIDTLGLVEFGR